MDNLKKTLTDNQIEITSELESLIFNCERNLVVSKKVVAKIKRITLKDLSTVHEDKDTAIDLIVTIVSNLSNTLAHSQHSDNPRVKAGYKNLYSKTLRDQVDTRKKGGRYKTILELLEKYEIIERGKNYSTKYNKSNEYRLTDKYFRVRVEEYKIKSEYAKKLAKQRYRSNFDRVVSSVIGRNELQNLSRIELPSMEEVETHLRSKIKGGFRNKKGKRLYILGKKKRDDSKLYMEDYLDMYHYLKFYFNIPVVTEENAGNRVITKFNIMPSVIRELIKIDGNALSDADFNCLHPNLAYTIYNRKNRTAISHEEVAEYLGITRKEAKIEHLSFFNKRTTDMQRSPLYKYYKDNHFELLHNVENDKLRHKDHKVTSRKLFGLETQIMSEIISRVYNRGMDCVYIFDELLVPQEDIEEVKSIMNSVAKEYKLETKV